MRRERDGGDERQRGGAPAGRRRRPGRHDPAGHRDRRRDVRRRHHRARRVRQRARHAGGGGEQDAVQVVEPVRRVARRLRPLPDRHDQAALRAHVHRRRQVAVRPARLHVRAVREQPGHLGEHPARVRHRLPPLHRHRASSRRAPLPGRTRHRGRPRPPLRAAAPHCPRAVGVAPRRAADDGHRRDVQQAHHVLLLLAPLRVQPRRRREEGRVPRHRRRLSLLLLHAHLPGGARQRQDGGGSRRFQPVAAAARDDAAQDGRRHLLHVRRHLPAHLGAVRRRHRAQLRLHPLLPLRRPPLDVVERQLDDLRTDEQTVPGGVPLHPLRQRAVGEQPRRERLHLQALLQHVLPRLHRRPSPGARAHQRLPRLPDVGLLIAAPSRGQPTRRSYRERSLGDACFVIAHVLEYNLKTDVRADE